MPLSLLDRLTDPQPEKPDLSINSLAYRRALEESVCRDLNALLNNRRVEGEVDSKFEQANKSLLTYGVVDFTSFNLTSQLDQERVRQSIERAIRQFEPRLSRVTVILDPLDISKAVLHLQIEAILRNDFRRDPISLGMTLRMDSRRILVEGDYREG